MTPTTLRQILATAGLTQAQAATLMGVQTRTMERWLSGTHAIPGPVARLAMLLSQPGRPVREVLAEMPVDTPTT